MKLTYVFVCTHDPNCTVGFIATYIIAQIPMCLKR
jgi:hypothetical protein